MSGTVSRQFQAVITVDDRTAAALAGIATRLRAIAAMSGMERMRASALGVQRSFAALAGSITRLGVAASAIGAGAGLGLAAMVRGAADATGELDDLSKRLGISTQNLQAFRFAAVMSGQSGETFTAAIVRLNRGMSLAAAGQNQDLAGLFQRLGISLRGANGQVRSAAEVLPQLAQAFMRNENPALRTRMAMVAFGRSGEALLPMLTDGAEGLAKLTEMFRRYGYEFSDEEVARGAEFGDTMDSLSTTLRGTADAIGSRLIPIIDPLLKGLRDWVRANRDLIATKVGEWAQSIADWVKTIDFAAVVGEVRGFIRAAQELLDKIGGWKTVGIAVAAYFTGPFVVAIGVLAADITTTLIPPLGRAVGMLASLGASSLAGVAGRLSPAAAALGPAAAAARASGGAAAAAAAAGAAAAVPTVAAPSFVPPGTAAPASAGAAFVPPGAVPAVAAGAPAAAARASWLARFLGFGRAVATTAPTLASAGLAVGMLLGSAEDPEVRRRNRQEGGGRWQRRGQTSGPGEETAADIERRLYGGVGGLTKLAPLYKPEPAAPQSQAQAPQGEVKVSMRFENVPQGARIDARSQGDGVRQPELDVGYATMGAF